jgi:4-amino-4-deoxy-L-arabinose transferase-like glycosyltransferase
VRGARGAANVGLWNFCEAFPEQISSKSRRTMSFQGRVCLRIATWVTRSLDTSVALVELPFAVAVAIGSLWGLPGSDSWAPDSISPRSCGLGAIAETYWPGHFHHYPPLHMALLTLVSLPWMALAASRVGTETHALSVELIKPLYMTGIEMGARLVTAAMAIATVHGTIVLWRRLAGRRAGVLAGVTVATNAIFVYYAHTGNLDVPYLFWLTWAFVELDRVACGEPREMHALLLATAAVLTKDQAAGALILSLPVYLVRGAVVSVAAYGVVSGALSNPIGFHDRILHLFGPASKPEMRYPGTLAGALSLTRDALHKTTDFTSWPIVFAAFAGVAVAWGRRPDLGRARLLLPLLAAISFAVFFTFPVRQDAHRYFLPESVFFAPYAALAFDFSLERWPRARSVIAITAVLAVAPALLGVASMDATLLADSRYAAERFLAGLAADSRVEVYGGPIFLPRIPSHLVAVRPGIEPIAERQAIAGVTDLVDPAMDPRPRAPEAIVLATELSDESMAKPVGWNVPFATMQYRDPLSHAFLRGLFDGSLGYARALRATCSLPWPLECQRVHQSVGAECWVYTRASDGSNHRPGGP